MTDDTPIVVDTSVVSYIFNRHPVAPYYLNQLRGRPLAVSFQTLEEIWFGARMGGWGRRRRNEMERHLQQYQTVWANAALVAISTDLRHEREQAGRRLSTADAWIAATAIMLDCPVASHDRDFSGIPGLELIRAPQP